MAARSIEMNERPVTVPGAVGGRCGERTAGKKGIAVITPASWITIARFFLAVPVLLALLSDSPDRNLRAFFLFLLAIASDWVDGYVARRFDQVSDLGKFLDPLADKILVSSLLVVLCLQGLASLPAVVLIIGREWVVTVLRWQALRRGRSFSASSTAKWKTDCQWIGIGLLLLSPHLPQPALVRLLANAALYLAVLLAFTSALAYSKYPTGE